MLIGEPLLSIDNQVKGHLLLLIRMQSGNMLCIFIELRNWICEMLWAFTDADWFRKNHLAKLRCSSATATRDTHSLFFVNRVRKWVYFFNASSPYCTLLYKAYTFFGKRLLCRLYAKAGNWGSKSASKFFYIQERLRLCRSSPLNIYVARYSELRTTVELKVSPWRAGRRGKLGLNSWQQWKLPPSIVAAIFAVCTPATPRAS